MMGGGGGGSNGGGNAERMLAQAEKLLISGDLNGSKTYAIRACEADHSLVDPAELILAVADTLIAGESRIRGTSSDLPDWYAVLRLVRLTHNPELVATQYSRLAVLLNPSRNRFPYSDQAFRLISNAWYVLSDPSRKTLYDRELHLSQFGQLGQLGFQLFNQTPQSPQQQSQSPQHQHQNQTVSFQNQQLPFQLHQPHFASQTVQTQSQPQQQQQQRSHFDQQLLQEQQQASWRQQFGQEHSSGSSSDWKRPLEEERLINLNIATERIQPSRRFAEPDRPPSRSFEASSHRRTPSTELTWPSKTISTSESVPWQSSEPARHFQSSSRSNEAAQLSLLPSVSDSNLQTRSIESHAVSKPQPVSKPHTSFLMSQPPPTSKTISTSESVPWQSSEPARHFQSSSRSNEAAQLSLLPSVSDSNLQTRSIESHAVSKPQPVSKPHTSFLMSQPPPTSKPFPMSQSSQNSKPFPVSQSSQNSNTFPMSQSSQKSKALPVSQPSQKSKPLPVLQRSLNSKPFPVSHSSQKSKPLPVSQPSQDSKPLPVSQPSSNSMSFPVSQPPSASLPFPVSQPPPASMPFPISQPPPASKSFRISQPQPTSKPLLVSQPPPAAKPLPVSQPPPTSKPLPVSQSPTTSKPLPVSQPPNTSKPSLTFQSTRPTPSTAASPLPPVFNSTQSFQPPPVSTSRSPIPAASTVPSPPPPAPVSQPTGVSNQPPSVEHTPKSGAARSDYEPEVPSFWTTCPYCFVLYEYPDIYEESVLKCQAKSCRRAYQAVKVPSPPPVTGEEDSYYCCWGFYPIGFSEVAEIPVRGLHTQIPVSGLHTQIPVNDLPKSTPRKPSPKVYYYDDEEDDNDDSYIESDPSEDDDDDDYDWRMSGTKKRKIVKQSKVKASAKSKTRKVIEVN